MKKITQKKRKLDEQNKLEYFNSIFKNNNHWVKPKKVKAYEELFRYLEEFYDARYLASILDDKVIIFMQLKDNSTIKVEEISKIDFLGLYEII